VRGKAARPNPPNNLPAQFSTFIGRERQIVEVLEHVRQEGIRLVTLTRPGGVGKTRLATQAATRRLAENFEDGVFFVSLAPIAEAPVNCCDASQLDVSMPSSIAMSTRFRRKARAFCLVSA
jgi:predicted ATPase